MSIIFSFLHCYEINQFVFIFVFLNKMSNEINGILFSNVQPVSGGAYQTTMRGEESFLQNVVTPIYEVLLKVT